MQRLQTKYQRLGGIPHANMEQFNALKTLKGSTHGVSSDSSVFLHSSEDGFLGLTFTSL